MIPEAAFLFVNEFPFPRVSGGDPDLLVLRAENPAYKDIELRGDDHKTVRILGKAIAFQSDVK